MPTWFNDNRDFGNISDGLLAVGMAQSEVNGIMGNNWLRFYETSFGPMG
jgi:membrane dipeptidase